MNNSFFFAIFFFHSLFLSFFLSFILSFVRSFILSFFLSFFLSYYLSFFSFHHFCPSSTSGSTFSLLVYFRSWQPVHPLHVSNWNSSFRISAPATSSLNHDPPSRFFLHEVTYLYYAQCDWIRLDLAKTGFSGKFWCRRKIH